MDRRVLTSESWNVLLACLGPDEEAAGREYLKIRAKLRTFLAYKGASDVEAAADRVIDQTAYYLAKTESEILATDKSRLFRAIGENTMRELRRQEKKVKAADTEFALRPGPERSQAELLDSLLAALRSLSREDRELVLTYYEGRGAERIRRRARLAQHLRVTMNALRVRVLRIRQKLLAALSQETLEEEATTP